MRSPVFIQRERLNGNHSGELSPILKGLLSVEHVIRCSVLFWRQDVLAGLQKATLSGFACLKAPQNLLLGLWGSSQQWGRMLGCPAASERRAGAHRSPFCAALFLLKLLSCIADGSCVEWLLQKDAEHPSVSSQHQWCPHVGIASVSAVL